MEDCWVNIADDLIDLRLRGTQSWDEDQIRTAVEEGAESAVYRRVVTQLMQELAGITIDTSHKMRFYNTVKMGLRTIKVDHYLKMDLHGSLDDRRYLLEYLISEVMANRLLESNLLEKSGEESMLFAPDARESNMKSAMKNICNVLDFKSSKIGTAILKRLELSLGDIAKAVPAGYLTPVMQRAELAAPLDLLERMCSLFNEQFTKRRELLLKRFRLTVQSFLWSDKAGVDLASLNNRTEAVRSILSNKPAVRAESIFSITHLSLFVATQVCISSADRKDLMRGEHKLYKLSDVPDRDGRVNTYNAEERLKADVERANASLKGIKLEGGGKQRAPDWTCPSCSATVYGSKSSCFRCGTSKDGKKAADWLCNNCNAVVFATKTHCFKCNAPRGNAIDAPANMSGVQGHKGGNRNRVQGGQKGGKGKGYSSYGQHPGYGSSESHGYRGYSGK
eukprot:TRINITY_DN35891_c0_g1_i1.p1 TRINITY_DN35891_c0_g1~~TRINITY_DN35891_c0_g1_i1.p1  ORF type:complete len:498 (+),score=199.57 TRINITY_DN35891_c0_g1_i1:146-1495(+)